MRRAYLGADIHDGRTLHRGVALLVEDGRVRGLVTPAALPAATERVVLPGGIVCPGFVDLQVNGGGGVMFGDAPSVETLRIMAKAHAAAGTLSFLPTLITDGPDVTARAVDAVAAACAEGVEGIAGLHLEGPHLSLARKGAHDPALIRPMMDRDLAFLCESARRLPNLLVTLAPEAATPEQIAALDAAGIVVALGHTDADYDTCIAAMRAGARMVTHLFNAMSQLTPRAPGLVGATLDMPGVHAGLIADGIHVHPASIRTAMAARPDGLFLVTDAMATAGSDIAGFELNGRRVLRMQGRLTLPDGTLAGADLDMPRAVSVMTRCACDLETAIAMATSRPASRLASQDGMGHLHEGAAARLVHLDPETWQVRRL